ncbi:MAG: c-type cytochrome [Flavobacteriia bacterium]|nr:c-type cytochrome [Flavobacteriia bacterium]
MNKKLIKISTNQMFKRIKSVIFGSLVLLLLVNVNVVLAQGEALYKAKCMACHQIHKDGTGPKLFEVRKKWLDGGANAESIYTWVNNWEMSAKKDPYAQTVSTWAPIAMSNFPELKKEEIDAIFDYVDAQAPVVAVTPEVTDNEVVVEDKGPSTWFWVMIAIVLFVIVGVVSKVRRDLKNALSESKSGEEFDQSYSMELRTWAWENKKLVGLASLIIVVALIVLGFMDLNSIGIVENYQPTQPIEFPHTVHAGVNGIDCKYCHNSVTKSKTAGLPTVNVCMNCHKQINGRTSVQQEKIKNIYAAAGWNPEGAGSYTGKTKPIVWNKVHVLPDHVYFNHSQHVVIGGVDCKQCHGDMTKQKETARVLPVSELNEIEGNVKLTKPTLTMGWCIECHGEKEIHNGPLNGKNNGYYNEIHKRLLNNDKSLYDKYLKDGKVTVKELGGWECAKCHY